MRTSRYSDRIKVRSYEADKRDLMRADTVLRLMQESASNQMSDEGLSYDDILNMGVTLVINRMDIVFDKPIRKYDDLCFATWPCFSKGATLPRDYEVLRDQEIVARGSAQWSFVHIEDKRILKADAVDFSCYYTEESRPVMKERLRIPKDIEMELVGQKEICYNDIDCNGHMNNVNYLHLVQDYIPELNEDEMIVGARLHFAKEAPLGDVVSIFRSEGLSEFSLEKEPNLFKKYYFKTEMLDGSLNFEAEIRVSRCL